jgi:hypothetical protein
MRQNNARNAFIEVSPTFYYNQQAGPEGDASNSDV